ncbi:MAG: dihydrolipoyl dehydrogenase [Candidatus Omnitrophota bacterium]|nr:MAG: dihydrolipoyl dehydrogenase [Candidatus Omnitrophota bacterium]
MNKNYDLAIIGAGPGGYVAAIRCAQLGFSVCLIEKQALGGVCLNCGCIPTKTLIKSACGLEMLKHCADSGITISGFNFDFTGLLKKKTEIISNLKKGVEFILKKRGIEIIRGIGKITDKNSLEVNGIKVGFKNCIIAIGSEPAQLKGMEFDQGKGILSSKQLLDIDYVPESLLIVGGGVIGCEFAYIFNAFGAKVTIVEAEEQILPLEDAEAVKILSLNLKKRGIKIFNRTLVNKINNNSKINEALLSSGETVLAEKVLIAAGRKPVFQDCGILELGIKQENNRIVVDQRMRTNLENFYAIGDCANFLNLAHLASKQGIIAAENIAGKKTEIADSCVPKCVYTDPQIASVGMSVREAKERGIAIKTAKFPFSAVSKALIEKQNQGFVKLISIADNSRIIGAVICGHLASELIAQLSIAIEHKLNTEQVARVIYAHPTFSEAVMEAAYAAEQMPVHILR